MSCPYKHILGVPKEGVHEMRVPGTDTAFVDYVLTLIGAWLLTRVSKNKIPLVFATVLLFLVGEVLHYVFCVPTQTLKFLKGLKL